MIIIVDGLKEPEMGEILELLIFGDFCVQEVLHMINKWWFSASVLCVGMKIVTSANLIKPNKLPAA